MRFKDVKRIIDKWDPLDLWCCHCPLNEYDIDSRAIWRAALENSNESFLYAYICDYYAESFRCMRIPTADSCLAVAQQISKLEGDKTVLHFTCQLLKREISEDFCCTLNMEALYSGRKSFKDGEPIDRADIHKTCIGCKNLFWTKEVIEEYVSNEIKGRLNFLRYTDKQIRTL